MVRVSDTHLILDSGLAIPLDEISLRVSRSSGPGGQHANKTSTRVDATFDVAASQTLSAGQRARVANRIGPIVRTQSQEQRSQLRNRERALTQLGERLDHALKPRRRRVATKPTSASVQRRLAGKRSRSEVKASRKRPDLGD